MLEYAVIHKLLAFKENNFWIPECIISLCVFSFKHKMIGSSVLSTEYFCQTTYCYTKLIIMIAYVLYTAIKSSWSLSSVDLDFSPYVITTRLLVEVAMEMNKFELVARHLGFEENQIIRLQEDYDSRHERCYQMLWEWWQNSPKQSPATLEELHRVMCFTDQGNCLPKILERNSKYDDIEWLCSATDISKKSLHYTVKNSTAGNTLLSDMAAKLAGTWRQVGRAIGVDDSELDEIQHDYQKVIEKAYQMLRRWREKYGSSALVSQLAIALLIVGQSKAISYFKMF